MNDDILFDILNEENIGEIGNYRKNGKIIFNNSNDHIDIKQVENGLEINIQDNTQDEIINVPVVITEDEFNEEVTNTYNIGKNARILIQSGCAIENSCEIGSSHTGNHIFNIGENSEVIYVEKHLGCGDIGNKKINTYTTINLENNSILTIDTTQISGVDLSNKILTANLNKNAKLEITDKSLTKYNDKFSNEININLIGENSKANIISKSIASNNSVQDIITTINGETKCFGHVSCDSIMMDDSVVSSTPKLVSKSKDALLSHEAVIGKISSEQILKLQTLGLTKEEAEREIINGFMI